MIDTPDLPDFKNPPAIETLIAFYYPPLKGWKTPYFGLFWQAVRKEYPRVEVQPRFVSEGGLKLELQSEKARLQVSGDVPVRWLYFHRSGKTLIQLQSDIFIQNWRKTSATAPYLHYHDLLPSFERMWARYGVFLGKNGVRPPSVRECEVTYVNHIDKGAGWNSLRDLANVISGWSGSTSTNFLPVPELVSINAVYPIKEKSGRLHFSIQPGIREHQQTLQLTVTARCKPTSSSLRDLRDALDVAREWVVRGFTDFTTGKMHEIWHKSARRKGARK